MYSYVDRIAGCLLGCAVGDAIGLPYEGLSPRRAKRFAQLPLRHRFALGHGMVSDDTDHTIFVAQSLLRSQGDVERFRSGLAWRLRLWFLCLPAGIGMATLKSILRLWLGMRNSGVYSAGNGPSMRVAVIGAALSGDEAARRAHVEAATVLTHTDPKALAGALAVAEIAARLASGEWMQKPSAGELAGVLAAVSSEPDWQAAIEKLKTLIEANAPAVLVAQSLGTRAGITGYTLHSVPFAIWAWHRHFGDYRATIEAITQAGGDVDTVAAIGGALAGMATGPQGIPAEWLEGIVDWPHSVAYLRNLAAALAQTTADAKLNTSLWLFPRGLLFTAIVLLHGFRRLLPPY